jgi:hypothetical protein
MKEDIHIKIAAGLTDADAPENLSGKRARDFIAQTVGKKKTIPFAVWGGSVIAVAASVVFAIVLFSPRDSQTFGIPNQLMEMQSIHSDVAQVDTTAVDSLDTHIVIESVEE